MMTFKELKNNILLSLYKRYKDNNHTRIEFKKLCKDNGIIYDSDKELYDAFLDLKASNYIKATFFNNNRGDVIGITPQGIDYVEDNLLSDNDKLVDSLRDTDKMIKEGYDVDVETTETGREEIDKTSNNDDKSEDVNVESSHEEKYSDTFYEPTESYKEPMDGNVNPCFGVDVLAECYIKQLDEIAKHTNENFCMLGIFGVWGRGKTYFFNRIKTRLDERQKSKHGKKSDESKSINYKIVEFNAWKYQDTPAIWAYLYENLYSSLDSCQKFTFWVKTFGKKILLLLAVLLAAWLLNILISWASDISDDVKSYINVIQIPLAWVTTISAFIYAYINKPFTVQKQINNYIKRKSYNNLLGIQSDLESDIEQLLKYIVSKPEEEQLLLFVDDIDRCTSDKMIHIINSLRIILENKEIQKRLIVICSVDSNKLKEGYCLYKGVDRDNEKFLLESREHIDKLFIFGIGLPRLDVEQLLEYLSEITDKDVNTDDSAISSTPYSTHRVNGSFVVGKIGETVNGLDDTVIKDIMADFLTLHKDIEINPRKIRIMYYRLLFAKNIIASGKGKMTKSTVLQILDKSIGTNIDLDIDNAMSDVVQTVVPY